MRCKHCNSVIAFSEGWERWIVVGKTIADGFYCGWNPYHKPMTESENVVRILSRYGN